MTNREIDAAQSIAKVIWVDPSTATRNEHVLTEGATASIGRATSNDIVVLDRHVSRQHAVITYRDGVFMISDLGSVNGSYVNDKRIEQPFPLFAGDTIRLYVPTLRFMSANADDITNAKKAGMLITAATRTGKGQLTITTGAQEGQVIPLILNEVTIGRATSNATWDIGLQDPSVSRPHARLRLDDATWMVCDLDSSNGTRINDNPLEPGEWYSLDDGDIIGFGYTLTLFRGG